MQDCSSAKTTLRELRTQAEQLVVWDGGSARLPGHQPPALTQLLLPRRRCELPLPYTKGMRTSLGCPPAPGIGQKEEGARRKELFFKG